jgi:hypothetical protein
VGIMANDLARGQGKGGDTHSERQEGISISECEHQAQGREGVTGRCYEV